MNRKLRAFLMLPLLIGVAMPDVQAATMKCRGFAFFYAELECDLPLPAATAGATFCQVAKPILWSATDTRATKAAADTHNRIGKRLCGWGKRGK